MGAREFFEAARRASDDYARCERQLLALKYRAESLGGGTSSGAVAGSGHDALERRVVAKADVERTLEGRMARDEALMSVAASVLFGGEDVDQHDGLSALVPSFWAEALWWHYLQDMKWSDVSDVLGYSPSYLKAVARQALDVVDAYGLASVADGMGFAEDSTE